jgi:hypothetical protein
MHSEFSNGNGDKGQVNPTAKSTSLIKKPENITKTKLRATEKISMSTILISLTFKYLSKIKPGMKVR